jgi:uncharacterized protein YjbI with pentapeptide repeats
MIQISAEAELSTPGLSRRSILQLGSLTLADLTGDNLTNPTLSNASVGHTRPSVILLWSW